MSIVHERDWYSRRQVTRDSEKNFFVKELLHARKLSAGQEVQHVTYVAVMRHVLVKQSTLHQSIVNVNIRPTGMCKINVQWK